MRRAAFETRATQDSTILLQPTVAAPRTVCTSVRPTRVTRRVAGIAKARSEIIGVGVTFWLVVFRLFGRGILYSRGAKSKSALP